MKREKIQIAYGLPSRELQQGLQTRFPNAGFALGGCMIGLRSRTTGFVCPECSQALSEWKKDVRPAKNLALNSEDLTVAAKAITTSLIDSVVNAGKLEAPAGQTALVAISHIMNNTSQLFDADILVNKIRVALNGTGKIAISMGFAEPVENSVVKASRRPDYTLSGKIIEELAQSGGAHKNTYIVQFSLTSAAGVLVWAEENAITKQGRRTSQF